MKAQIIIDGKMAYMVTSLEPTNVGFKMSFRTYDLENECGGFETTVIVANATLAQAPAFTGMKHEIKSTAKVFRAELVKMTINNVSSEKWRFQNVKKQLN